MKIFKHIIITVLAFSIVGVLAGIALNIGFLDPVAKVIEEFSFTDTFYQIMQETDEPETNDEITIVDMTELHRRRDLAKVLGGIIAQEPKTIGVDIVFEGLKEDSIGDEMIWNVVQESDNMVFSYRLLNYVNDSIGYQDAVHSFFAKPLEVREGFTNMQRDLYGSIKRVLSLGRKHRGEMRPSFVTEIVSRYEGRNTISAGEEDLDINFTPTCFTVLPADSVGSHPELLKDRLVLLGAMKDEGDMHYTPIGKMSGVELLAYSIQTLREQSEVWEMPVWLLGIVSFLLVLLTQVGFTAYSDFAQTRKTVWARFILGNAFTKSILVFLWMIAIVGIAFIVFFRFHVSINLGWTLSGMAFLELARIFYQDCTQILKKD